MKIIRQKFLFVGFFYYICTKYYTIMETTRANEVIICILQQALAGQLKIDSSVNPQNIAEAIAAKITFEKSYNNGRYDEMVGILIDRIVELKKEAEAELSSIKTNGTITENKEEIPLLLQNFIRGKITVYDEILSILK